TSGSVSGGVWRAPRGAAGSPVSASDCAIARTCRSSSVAAGATGLAPSSLPPLLHAASTAKRAPTAPRSATARAARRPVSACEAPVARPAFHIGFPPPLSTGRAGGDVRRSYGAAVLEKATV